MKRGSHDDLAAMSLTEASRLVRHRKISATSLTQACLARIEHHNPVLNAFIMVTPDIALEQAKLADEEIARGQWRGPLHGIPLALKDNIDTAGIRTSAASAVYRNRVPLEDAEVVRRLKRAGAVLLGKLNMDEFAIGWGNTNSHWGPARNPWSLEYVTGGSSGGCGAALAANLCYGALGTDTGGSVRMPASQCGVVGLKPTYGLVSNRGVVPDMPSLQHVGPLCRSVADTALLLQAIAGHDRQWPASVEAGVPCYVEAMAGPAAKIRVGVPRVDFMECLDDDIRAAMLAAIEVIAGFAHSVKDVRFPEVNREIFPHLFAEAYAFHQALLDAGAPYQSVTRKILQHGGSVTAAAYRNARKQLADCRSTIGRFFDEADVDFVVMPTFRTNTPTIEAMKAQLENFSAAMPDGKPEPNTAQFNILGLPAISIPCGFNKAGLPIGLQIVGRHFEEAELLAFARLYESAVQWHLRTPSLS